MRVIRSEREKKKGENVKSREGVTTSLFSRSKCANGTTVNRQEKSGERRKGRGQGDHFLSPRCILFHELKSFGEAMARRRFYRWNFVFSEKTFEESFRDSASRSQWDGMNGWSTGG